VTNSGAHPTSLDEGQTRLVCNSSFLPREIELTRLICVKDKFNNREAEKTKVIDVSKLPRFDIIATSHFQSDNELSIRRYVCCPGTFEIPASIDSKAQQGLPASLPFLRLHASSDS
jgi:hypothetical protein